MRTILILGLLTGMRIGEILALCVEDVDLIGGLPQVRRDVYRGHVQDGPKTKRGKRHVPLAEFLIAAIQKWIAERPAGSSWLSPSEAGTPYHDKNLLHREVWPVCDRLGIPRFGWHSCRHSLTTYGGNRGGADAGFAVCPGPYKRRDHDDLHSPACGSPAVGC